MPVVTKDQLRKVIADMISDSRKSGVPEDGLVSMLTYWVVGHLKAGTQVVDQPDPELAIQVLDLSGDGTGPWTLRVNGYSVASWPWKENEHDPHEYADEVARILRKALR